MHTTNMPVSVAALAVSGMILSVGLGCSGSRVTTRTVDDPAGEAVEYGPPTGTKYVAEIDAGRDYGAVTVYRKSSCDLIPVTVLQRYKETLRGDKVVDRAPLSKRQIAGQPQGTIPCDQGYANNVEVLIEADGGRFSLGVTDEFGRVSANLAEVFQVGSFEEAPAQAKILLRSRKAEPLVVAGELSLKQLGLQQERVKELLAELETLFARAETTPQDGDIGRSYEVYFQLVELAPSDPRVRAASARFWELLYQRKRDDAVENLGKNLDALKKAQDVLRIAGDAAIPIYVQAAVNSGTLDRKALEWSSLRLVRALKGAPAVCSAGFSWTALPTYGWPRDAELASHYVNFAYGPSHIDAITQACRAF